MNDFVKLRNDFLVLVFFFSLRILRKPAFFNALFLFEELQNTPQTGAPDYAKNRTDYSVVHQQTGNDEQHSGKGKSPPATGAEVVFTFDDDRVEDTDNQEGRYGNN